MVVWIWGTGKNRLSKPDAAKAASEDLVKLAQNRKLKFINSSKYCVHVSGTRNKRIQSCGKVSFN